MQRVNVGLSSVGTGQRAKWAEKHSNFDMSLCIIITLLSIYNKEVAVGYKLQNNICEKVSRMSQNVCKVSQLFWLICLFCLNLCIKITLMQVVLLHFSGILCWGTFSSCRITHVHRKTPHWGGQWWKKSPTKAFNTNFKPIFF